MTDLISTTSVEDAASAVATKKCPRCGVARNTSEYYMRKGADGTLFPKGQCKVCLAEKDTEKRNAKRLDPVTGERIPVPPKRPKSTDPEVLKERIKEDKKKWREKNRELTNEKGRQRRAEDPESIKANQARYRERNREGIRKRNRERAATEEVKEQYRQWALANPEKVKAAKAKHREENKEQIKEAARLNAERRRKEDLNYRIMANMRSRVRAAIKQGTKGKGQKAAKTAELIGCSVEDLILHIEKQFYGNMEWSNFGEWEIDHITPCAAYDLSDPEQQRQCFHYTNLQPLFGPLNRLKRDHVDFDVTPYILIANQAWAQETFVVDAIEEAA